MEALGATASILQLISTVSSVTKYVRDVKGSKKEREKLSIELESLVDLLKNLASHAQEAERQQFIKLPQTSALVRDTGPLTDLQRLINGLAEQLDAYSQNGQPIANTTSSSTSRSKFSSIRKGLFWPTRRRACLDILGDVERIKSLVSLTIQQDLLSAGWQLKKDTEIIPNINANVGQVSKGLNKLDLDLNSAHPVPGPENLWTGRSLIMLTCLDEKRQKIRSWLSPINFLTMQKDRLSDYHPGSCSDFLQSSTVQSWMSGIGTRMWCTGMPGSGKTIAASALVEQVREKYRSDKDVRVVAVFCNYKMSDTLSVATILAGIWLQMTTFTKLSSEAISLHDRNVEMGTRPSCEDFTRLLLLDLKLCLKVLVVVDALDEISENCGLKLLKELDKLGSSINIMITSRLSPTSTAPLSLRSAPVYEISATSRDLSDYIDARIDGDSLLATYTQKTPQLRIEIQNMVKKKSGKMFLMARLHLDSLARKDSVRSMRQQLDSLPEDLDSVYKELMSRVLDSRNPRHVRAEKLLMWISIATRYLTFMELQCAMSIDDNDDSLNEEDLCDLHTIINSCAGTVVIDSRTQEVRFVHMTFHEYIISSRSTLVMKAEMELGSACLTYLMFRDFEHGRCTTDQDMKQRLVKYPLLIYAASNWHKHLRDISFDDTTLNSRVAAIFTSEQYRSSFSQALFLPPSQFEGFCLTYPRSPSALWLAAYCGLSHICSSLLEDGHVVDEPISDGSTPLCAAARVGSVTVIEELLRRSADVNGVEKSRPLLEAAKNGHFNAVRILLLQGSSPTQTDSDGRTALHTAVRGDFDRVVKLLIEHESDPRAYSQKSVWTPLHSAAANNSVKCLRLLLNLKHLDLNPQTFDDETPLHIAVKHGHLDTVDILVKQGARADIQNRFGRTPLHLAADHGEYTMCRTLIDHQTTTKQQLVDCQDNAGQTPLHKAAARGLTTIIELLLLEGADADTVDASGASALHLASMYGHKASLVQLLSKGANLNLKLRGGGSCEQLATANGHSDIVEILRQHNKITPPLLEDDYAVDQTHALGISMPKAGDTVDYMSLYPIPNPSLNLAGPWLTTGSKVAEHAPTIPSSWVPPASIAVSRQNVTPILRPMISSRLDAPSTDLQSIPSTSVSTYQSTQNPTLPSTSIPSPTRSGPVQTDFSGSEPQTISTIAAAAVLAPTTTIPQSVIRTRPGGASKRVAKELASFSSDPPPYCSAAPLPDSPFDWQATILGPSESDYAGGVFFLEVNFPDDYPFSPPNIFFTTKIYHTNIHAESGHISYNMFNSSTVQARWKHNPHERREYTMWSQDQWTWSPGFTVGQCFRAIVALLCAPDGNIDSSYPSAQLYVTDRKSYHETARAWTRKYAC